MRAALIPTLMLPLLLTYCGAKGDLVIGQLEPVSNDAGSSSGSSTAGASGTAGTEQGGSQSDDLPEGGVAGVSEGGADAGAGGVAGAAGAAGTDVPCVGDEEPPVGSLIHRYSFDGTGATVADSVGGADGTLMGGALLDDSGVLKLAGNRDGQPDQYLDLPDGLISSLDAVTVVAWTQWLGGAGYQRVFDFGISDLGVGQGNSGKSYIAVMPSTGFANGTGLGAEIAAPGLPTLGLGSNEMMDNRPSSMVAFALQSGVRVGLFLDAKLLLQTPTTLKLSDIKDVNDFVGESQWSKDHPYHGNYDEFRIYDSELDRCQLQTLLNRGPDAP